MRPCPAIGCPNSHTRDRFCCKRHWFMLPKNLRDSIWSSYRNGNALRDYKTHLEAARKCWELS